MWAYFAHFHEKTRVGGMEAYMIPKWDFRYTDTLFSYVKEQIDVIIMTTYGSSTNLNTKC